MIEHVTELTGLDPAFVKFSGGRLETGAYLREVFREEGKLGSVYDSNVTSFDPFPFAHEQRAERSYPGQHRSSADYGHGGLCNTSRRMEDRRAL